MMTPINQQIQEIADDVRRSLNTLQRQLAAVRTLASRMSPGGVHPDPKSYQTLLYSASMLASAVEATQKALKAVKQVR